MSDPKTHHYIPQFYMRQFACKNDPTKITAVVRHDPFILTGQRKSISRIGCEDHLHTVETSHGRYCFESDLNKHLETPFCNTATWSKISAGEMHSLDNSDRLNL